MFARCRPRRVSCPWGLLGAIPVSLIETAARCRAGNAACKAGALGRGTRTGALEEPGRAAACHHLAALPGDCYFEIGRPSPPGRRMQGSSVTSSGSQSSIFLVMFLNGRIHYAGAANGERRRCPLMARFAQRTALWLRGRGGRASSKLLTSWPPQA